jgi:molecular chaperone Hsp33
VNDELHKFLFEGLPVRGMLVRLGPSWREVQARHAQQGAYPAPVRTLLGEMAAAAALMQASVTFDGALVLQVFGDGPVKLAVVETQPDLAYRATAKVVGPVPDDARLAAMVNLHGKGRCAITLDPRDRSGGAQPYQGIVALHGDAGEPLQRVAEVLEHYMLQSEQLDTRLLLACDETTAAGLLIQRLPVEGEGNLERARREDEIGISEAFNRIAHLAATVSDEELLGLDFETLMRRLFWEEQVRHFEPLAPRFACTCSRDRVHNMLRSLGEAEVRDIVAERGDVEIGCDFCGTQYRFDAVDVGAMFAQLTGQAPGSSAVN